MDPITIALGLAQLAPTLMRFFQGDNKNVALAETVIGIAKGVTGRSTGQDALKDLKEDPELARRFNLEAIKEDNALEIAYLGDRKDARARDVKFLEAGKSNNRANVMLALTFLGLLLCVAAMIFMNVDANTAVGGVLIMLVGKLTSMWGTAFDFEFGSSKGSKEKDEVNSINALKGLRT